MRGKIPPGGLHPAAGRIALLGGLSRPVELRPLAHIDSRPGCCQSAGLRLGGDTQLVQHLKDVGAFGFGEIAVLALGSAHRTSWTSAFPALIHGPASHRGSEEGRSRLAALRHLYGSRGMPADVASQRLDPLPAHVQVGELLVATAFTRPASAPRRTRHLPDFQRPRDRNAPCLPLPA